MSRLYRGLLLALAHLLIVCSLGAKLSWDRHHLPRVWVRAAASDPDLPVRGRYASIRLEAEPRGLESEDERVGHHARLAVEGDRLVAEIGEGGERWVEIGERDGRRVALLQEPVAFFLPEQVPDPTVRPPGEELWAEVTVPRKGPPRPIRLGVRRPGGEIVPLPLR